MANEEIQEVKVKYSPMKNKNIWTISYKDGLIEEKELPTFIDRCSSCGAWINKIKNPACALGSKDCCISCAEECKREKVCQLK